MLLASAVSADPAVNLQLGLAIELSVLPPYLYSLWSIKSRSQGASDAAVEAALAMRSVVYEEMLHAGLAANMLNAIGVRPAVTAQLMKYPGVLPGHVTSGPYAFQVELRRLSSEAARTFMRIELPEWDPTPDARLAGGWTTIPEFYGKLKKQLSQLAPGSFGHGRQLPPRDNPGAGRLVAVVDYGSASQAIDTIVDQGEGHKPKDKDAMWELDFYHEVSHFLQFASIADYFAKGLVDPARDLYPVIDNPDASKYSPAQQKANLDFNVRYSQLLDTIQAALCTSNPDIWGAATRHMTDLGNAAAALRNCGNVPGEAYFAGPTFEYLSRGGTH